jgi:hypothetical protein
MSKEINHQRRNFLNSAVVTLAASGLGLSGSINGQSNQEPGTKEQAVKPKALPAFGTLKQIAAGVLNVGCTEG